MRVVDIAGGQVLAADILVIVSPTWMGQVTSVAQRVLERLDAELGQTDSSGRPILFDKVAVVGVVGNEDGAHRITSQLMQALNDVGFTILSRRMPFTLRPLWRCRDTPPPRECAVGLPGYSA